MGWAARALAPSSIKIMYGYNVSIFVIILLASKKNCNNAGE
jgi:hypothetical protein